MVAVRKIQEASLNQRLPTSDNQLSTSGGWLGSSSLQQQPTARVVLAPPAYRWKPRGVVGHTAWRADITDRLSTTDLLHTSCTRPPNFDDVVSAFPGENATTVFSLFQHALVEYREENTAVFHLIMSTIDLNGPRQESDILYIMRHFHDGVNRDGQGLLKWCDSFADHTATGEQDRLQIALANARLDPSSGVTVDRIELHCSRLLSIWTKVSGNDVAAPASFNARLLSSIPPTSTGPLCSLRSWLADKITDGAPFLSEPDTLIDRLLAHARTLGIPPNAQSSVASIFAVTSANDCGFCDSNICTAGKEIGDCLAFSPKEPSLRGATVGQRDYVVTARKYVAAFKPDTLKNVPAWKIRKQLQEWKNGAARKPVMAPVLAGNVSDANAFDAWLESNQLGSRVVAVLSSNSLSPVLEEGGTGADKLFPASVAAPVLAVGAYGALKISDGISDKNAFDAWLEANVLCPATELGGAPMAALEPEEPPVPAVPAALCGDCVNVIGNGVGIGSPLRAARAVVSELRSPDAMSLPVLHLPAGTPLAPQPEPRPLVFQRRPLCSICWS